MYPICKGTVGGFWEAMYHLDPPTRLSGIYPPRNGKCIYFIQGMHRHTFYTVPESDVEASFAELIRNIENRPHSISKKELSVLKSRGTITELVNARLEVDHARFERTNPELILVQAQQLATFESQWTRAHRFWINIVFEAVFLNGLLCIVAIAAFTKQLHLLQGLTAGAIPPLLLFPYYLGYCTWTFTSVGPSGGALYPWLIVPFHLLKPFVSELDQTVLAYFPQPLAALSQDPGPFISVTSGAIGIVAPSLLGLALGIVVYLGSRRSNRE